MNKLKIKCDKCGNNIGTIVIDYLPFGIAIKFKPYKKQAKKGGG